MDYYFRKTTDYSFEEAIEKVTEEKLSTQKNQGKEIRNISNVSSLAI